MKEIAPNYMRYYRTLMADAGRVEVRLQTGSQWTSDWALDLDQLFHLLRNGCGNVYTSLHHVCGDNVGYIRNEDVDRFTRLFFDFDPVRPKNTPSSDAELELARQAALEVRDMLAGYGWYAPAIGMSGNGYHLHYRTAIMVDADSRAMMTRLYKRLASICIKGVEFDMSVRNPGRICCAYGTMKRKGKETPERPHRRSTIQTPPRWNQITPPQIAMVAGEPEQPHKHIRGGGEGLPAGSRGDYASLDVVRWFQSYALYLGHLEDNKHAVRCPWSSEHTTEDVFGDAIIFEPDGGWAGFACKHGHCQGRNILDVIKLLGDADRFCYRQYRRAG